MHLLCRIAHAQMYYQGNQVQLVNWIGFYIHENIHFTHWPSKMTTVMAFLVLGLALALTGAVRNGNQDDLDRLSNYLQSMPKTLPLGREPVTVTLSYTLMGLTELNLNGYVETTGYLGITWTDPRLVFPQSFSSVSRARVDPSTIWHPDIELYSAASTGLQILNRNLLAVVTSDGLVSLYQQVTARSICDVSGQLATQKYITCSLKFGSWTYNGFELNLQQEHDAPELDLSSYTATGVWHVVNGTQKRSMTYYSCCTEPYIDVTYTFVIEPRKIRL